MAACCSPAPGSTQTVRAEVSMINRLRPSTLSKVQRKHLYILGFWLYQEKQPTVSCRSLGFKMALIRTNRWRHASVWPLHILPVVLDKAWMRLKQRIIKAWEPEQWNVPFFPYFLPFYCPLQFALNQHELSPHVKIIVPHQRCLTSLQWTVSLELCCLEWEWQRTLPS